MGGRCTGGTSKARALVAASFLTATAALAACGDDAAVTVGQSDVDSGGPETASGPTLKAFDLGDTKVRFGQSSVNGLAPGFVSADGDQQGDIVLIDIDAASFSSAGIPDAQKRWIVAATTLLNERYLVADLDVCDSPYRVVDDNEFCDSGNPIGRELWVQHRDSGEWLQTSVPTDVMVQPPSLLAGGRLELSGRTGSAMQEGQAMSLATVDLDAAFGSGNSEVIVHDARHDARCIRGAIHESSLELVDGRPVAVVAVERNSGDTERWAIPDDIELTANGTAPPPAVFANWHCGVEDGYFIASNGDGTRRLWNLRDASKGPWEVADASPEIAATRGRVAVLLRAQEEDPNKPYRLFVIDRDGVQHWVELGELADANASPAVFAIGGTIFFATLNGEMYVVS